jgi:UDP-N-acetylmuramate: L-alanyl-gamma-D-glutamyl-meso-diaminopimelate ligase
LSAIDRRPKFHLYQPNIALISGIAWDHINFSNVWKLRWTVWNFIGKITNGGILVYNEDDAEARFRSCNKPNWKLAYHTQNIRKWWCCYWKLPEGDMPIEVLGT